MIAEAIPLGELTKVQTGKLDANASSENGGYPFFTCAREPLKIDRWKYDLDAVLVAGNGDLNVKHYKGKFEAYQRTYILSSLDDQRLDTRYLFHFLDKYVEKLREQSIGGIIKYIKLEMLTGAEIPLPPLDEQKRLATILDQADALRQLRQSAVDRLNALAHSIFNDMFGDPIANERKWEIMKLKELSTRICSGSTPAGGKKVYVDDGIAFLRSQNVWRRRIDLDDIAYIDEATHKKMGKTSLQKGDILITKTGRINTENSSLGRAALFTGKDGSANINGHVYLIRTKAEVLEGFVEYVLAMPEYREYIRSVCVGGIDKRQINKQHLDEFPIIYPPVQAQQEFLRRLSKIESQKRTALKQLELCESLFHSVQHRAFRGEL